MVLVGVENGDTTEDMKWLVAKTAAMRIFPDDNGVMNLPVTSVEAWRNTCCEPIYTHSLYTQGEPPELHPCSRPRAGGRPV